MLFTQREILSDYILATKFSWLQPLVSQISDRFRSPEGTPHGFPCLFAQNAHARGNIIYLPVPHLPDPGGYDYQALFDGLSEYLEKQRQWDGSVNSAKPLLAIFQPVAHIASSEDFAAVFTGTLQYLIDNDPIPWPDGTPKNPDAEYWSMCVLGTQIFVNVSHPDHVNRLSRNLCDALVLVINPRDRFDVVAGANKKGAAIREHIRRNIDLYDRIPRSLFLGHYQSGDLEWPQYMLPDDNDSPPLECPLKFR